MNTVLQGVRVITFTNGWAGPMVGQMLGDFGADIIKVESCRRLDWARGTALVGNPSAAQLEKLWEWGTTFNSTNHNQRSVTLELSSFEGKELFRKLISISDVMVENFAPRVLGQLGITYEDLRQINPSLVLLSMPMYGHSGPWAEYVGYAQTSESLAGIASLCGYEGDTPVLQGAPYGDPIAGVTGTMAVLMALRHRRRTGNGQNIEISQIENVIPHVGGPLMDYVMNKRLQPRLGNRSLLHAPWGVYRTTGEDYWVAITVTSDAQWLALCNTIGQPDLANDPRFVTLQNRLANRDVLDAIVTEWTCQHDRFEVMHLLQDAGIPAGPVLGGKDLAVSEQLAATDFFVNLHKEAVGTHPYPGVAIRLNKTPGKRRSAAPNLGQHNHEILENLMGLSLEDVQRLEEEEKIGYAPTNH